jgi:hypothetical protein
MKYVAKGEHAVMICHHLAGRLNPHIVPAIPIKTEGSVMCLKRKKVELSLCIPQRHRGRLEV